MPVTEEDLEKKRQRNDELRAQIEEAKRALQATAVITERQATADALDLDAERLEAELKELQRSQAIATGAPLLSDDSGEPKPEESIPGADPQQPDLFAPAVFGDDEK